MHKLIFLSVLLSFCNLGFGQTKYEKEFRIKEKEVPPQALLFLEGLNFDKNIKWYKEIGLHRTSVEAKTKYKKAKHSIEFSAAGDFEDIEVKIKWKKMPLKSQANISNYFQSAYKKHKIEKLQIQYLSKQDFFAAQTLAIEKMDASLFNFEIVVKTKLAQSYKKYEYLFSGTGEFLQKLEIVGRNTDNIEF